MNATRVRRPLPPASIPLFTVHDGHLSRRTGRRSWEKVDRGIDDAVSQMRAAVPPQELVYLWDADGVEAGAANHEFYQHLERAHIPPWIDAGCRSAEDAMDAFFAGAEVLTVRLDTMKGPELEDFADLSEGEFHLLVRIDQDRPNVPLSPWDVKRLVGELHASGAILEAGTDAQPDALEKFAKLVGQGGITVSLLSPEPLPWLQAAATRVAATNLIVPLPKGMP